MSGKRLLDVAAIFNASRSVVQKHAALRSRQLDVYSRTSTLARAVKSQSDRVTETVKAVSILAGRLNEGPPKWMSEDVSAGEKADVRGSYTADGHFSERVRAASERLADGEHKARHADNEGEFEVKQTEASEQPLPDGTIPTSRSEVERRLQANEHPAASTSSPTTAQSTMKEHKQENSARSNGELKVTQAEATEQPLPDGTIPVAKKEIEQKIQANRDALSKFESTETMATPQTAKFRPAPWAQTIHYKNSLSSSQRREAQRNSESQIPSRAADYDNYKDPLEEGHDKDSFYHKSEHVSQDLSSLPRMKIPKHISDVQEIDEHISVKGINSDSFSDNLQHPPSKTVAQAIPEQDQDLPEGINTDIFHSPRVAKILGGRTHDTPRAEFTPRHAQSTPVDHTKTAEGTDQASFNVRESFQQNPTIPAEPLTPPPAESSMSPDVQKDDVEGLAQQIAVEGPPPSQIAPVPTPYDLRESRVPSSRFGRLWNYGGLAAGMFGGAITESLKRATGSGGQGSFMLSAGNMDRLVTKLSRMRGAALKLGQMISFQDSKMLPPAVQEVLQRVQDRADYMPASQRDKVLASNLGQDWRDLFDSFDEKPLAAASIGQVHSAVLKSNGKRVAVKIQYPGVADSIDSDLSNLTLLLTASRLLPKGLFLDKTIENARTELGWECDYIREAEASRKFQTLLADDKDTFVVPQVYAEASGQQVLTMEFMDGVGVTRVQSFTQEQRDWIGTQILRLCLREITEFKYMQTDPNWTNFLFNAETNKLELLDFGASREYPEEFIDSYSRLLAASSKSDKATIRDLSIKLGYLTGQESKAMLDAHIKSVMTLAEPFLQQSPEVYDFKDQTITERVKALIPIMIRERLAPPPEETYSLHRKLSGAFLLCAKLGSRVRCRELFVNSMTKAGIL